MAISFVTTENAFGDPSCSKCGGTKPTCCSCPTEQARELVDRWLLDRRLLDQAFVTMQDRQALTELITQLVNLAATSMRSACVEKVKALAESWAKSVDEQWEDRPDLSFDAAERLKAAGEIITALESVSIQEQRNEGSYYRTTRASLS